MTDAAPEPIPQQPGLPPEQSHQRSQAVRSEPRCIGALDVVIAIALGLAAVAGAFAVYKNELRNHAATVHFTEGITNFDEAGQLTSTANTTLSRDQAQFLAYTSALHDGKTALADYILHHVMDAQAAGRGRLVAEPGEHASARARADAVRGE